MSNDTQPEIRFPGFTEAWEQRKLSDVASIVGGGTPSTSNPEYWDGDIDWYAPAEIGDQIYVNKSLKTITELGQQKSSAKILPIGTVLFTSRAGIGNTAILAKEGTTNQGFQSIVPHENKLDSYFIFSRTHELKRYGEVTGAGSTFAEVSGKQMAKMPILIPYIDEQRKIGAFFGQIDEAIALHQRKLDLLKETKKGFLQKMFPKNGAKVPEIRFPGFTEDWEQRKLGDVTAEVFQGINTAGDKVEYSDTGTPILQAKHITGGDVTFDEARFLDKERYSNYFPKYVPVENDILFANIGTIGPSTVVRDESEFLVAWNILKITLKKPEIAEFIQLQLDQLNQKHYFDSVLTGNATKFVNKDEMLRTPISVPTIEEQKKVGAFFSNIQRAITLHQRKLDLLKETKKGFLQKMFV